MESCAVVVECLPDGNYRASCSQFPDCEAVRPTPEAAREAVEAAIGYLLQQRNAENPIDALFQRLRAEGRKAFMPFITGGDPDLDATAHLVRQLAANGADLIEIGFPYSDPIADGPVIQASFTRALDRGLRIADLFTCLKTLADVAVPRVGMVSYSLVYHRGPEAFLDQALDAGLSGLIVPDLPLEEAEPLALLCAARNACLIQMVTPTTSPERAARIVRLSSGFVYVVSVTGITGERDRLPDRLRDQLAWLRQQTDLPLCVGFGVSKPEHVRTLRDVADGIIVGSALVRRLEQASRRPLAEVAGEITELTRSLAAALNPL